MGCTAAPFIIRKPRPHGHGRSSTAVLRTSETLARSPRSTRAVAGPSRRDGGSASRAVPACFGRPKRTHGSLAPLRRDPSTGPFDASTKRMCIASGAPMAQPGRTTSHDLISCAPIERHRFRHTAPVRGRPLVSSQLGAARRTVPVASTRCGPRVQINLEPSATLSSSLICDVAEAGGRGVRQGLRDLSA
jgi:hypothetical protein